jgi:ABC-type Na+ efflux pump permease subunit
LSYIVKNPKTYKEFSTLSEAKEVLGELDDYEVYETDFFGNLKKLSNNEIIQLMASEKINQSTQNSVETQKTGKEELKTEKSQESSVLEKPRAIEESKNLKEEKKEETPHSKLMRTLLILFMIIIVAFFIVFIIWPLFKDVYELMVNPPKIGI